MEPAWRKTLAVLRVATVAAAAAWAWHFLLTEHFAGGLDARGYANTMIDALAQARSGHWPVFVGQGELQWNGSIHPFRTAPYYLNLGIALDVLTGRSLSPLGVVHLVLLFSLVQAAVLLYVLLVRLEPGSPWLAWIAALCWLLSPLATVYVVNLEMYMTVMTLGWLPLVFYGNVRLFRCDAGAGWAWVAAGLALTWMSHAPVAAWTSLATVLIQGCRLLLRDFNWPAWRRAAGGLLLFGVLSAYYFYSIVEMSPINAASSAAVQVSLLAWALAFAAGFRLLAGGSWRWWWLGLAALGALGPTNRLYLNWAAGLLAGATAVKAWRHWRPHQTVQARLPELAMAAALAAAAAAVHLPFPFGAMGARFTVLQTMQSLYPAARAVLRPLSPTATALTDLQLGYLLWAAAIVGCVAALGRGRWEARVLALVLMAAVPWLVPVPGLTACFIFCTPDWLLQVSGVLLWTRILPEFSLLVVFTVFLALASWRPRRTGATALILAGAALVLGAGLDWQLKDLFRMQKRGRDSVVSAELTKQFYRTDSKWIYYGYPYLPAPAYVLNGVQDYHLESRLLAAEDLRLLPDPLLEAPQGREVTLTTEFDPAAPNWLKLKPSFRFAPGERQIWKFEFFDKTYYGTFIGIGPAGFRRDYSLPVSGFYDQSFGVDPGRPKTLAFWNSLDQPQDVDFSFLMPAARPGFGDFAKVRIQRYRVEDLQIQTLGLMPYRARLKALVPSFLETPRIYIPGYRAKVDGWRVPVEMSPQHLAMVRVEPGVHEVEMVYRPTPKLGLALAVSLLGWLGLVGAAGLRWKSGVRSPAAIL